MLFTLCGPDGKNWWPGIGAHDSHEATDPLWPAFQPLKTAPTNRMGASSHIKHCSANLTDAGRSRSQKGQIRWQRLNIVPRERAHRRCVLLHPPELLFEPHS
ncbi:hypothetical protein FA13DRAFT_1452091 [Coprinellus micaceus]|uniref:Uncharacterized protein n=1 Tax=Coprinellus micaceus TaxID=71717 RepID=A0A4Y7SMZ2_COPMI|nr:hypothetical protein FA13DRAFT_1452091 [Coprinellus micaceus]